MKKPETKTVSIRLPLELVDKLQKQANAKYRSLSKHILAILAGERGE